MISTFILLEWLLLILSDGLLVLGNIGLLLDFRRVDETVGLLLWLFLVQDG